MKRRFVIYEATPRWPNEILSGISAIPESELKRRLLMITGGDYREGDIDILLHGEKKQVAEPNAWDEWVDRMPYWGSLTSAGFREWQEAMSSWLRACPCKKCT